MAEIDLLKMGMLNGSIICLIAYVAPLCIFWGLVIYIVKRMFDYYK